MAPAVPEKESELAYSLKRISGPALTNTFKGISSAYHVQVTGIAIAPVANDTVLGNIYDKGEPGLGLPR